MRSDNTGNLYVVKGRPEEGSFYPCVVAHTDTVHEITGRLVIVRVGDALTGMDSLTGRPSGCGGDDKVGVYIALEMLRRLPACKAAFFRDEESGCIGSRLADMAFFEDVAFVLQADRMGNSDFIKHTNGVSVYSQEFYSAIRDTLNTYGYSPEYGVSTDVGQLKLNGLGVSCANVSCGYWRHHSADEYVNLHDVETCLNLFYDLFSAFCHRQWPHRADPDEFDRYYGGQGGQGGR
jgi:putative aminopeptidase FrvX